MCGSLAAWVVDRRKTQDARPEEEQLNAAFLDQTITGQRLDYFFLTVFTNFDSITSFNL